jgi:hypothetical protein
MSEHPEIRPERARPELTMMTVIGVITLISAASVYATYGVSAYPRQEWIVESLAALIFMIPVVNLLRLPGSITSGVRIMGGMLLLHSLWDTLHWPGSGLINTPIDPWIPKWCPIVDVVVGTWLLIRGK